MTSKIEEVKELGLKLESFLPALQNAQANVAEFFSGLGPSITASFQQSTALEGLPKIEGLGKVENEFLALLDNHLYASVRELRLYVPSGFKGSLVDYSNALLESVKYCQAFPGTTLREYTAEMARLTAFKDAPLGTKDHTSVFEALQKTRAELDKKVATFFDSSMSAKSETTVGKCFSQNKEWIELFNTVHAIERTINSLNMHAIQEEVKKAEGCLDILYERAQAGKFDHASPEVLRNLGKGAYQIAQELEFLSVTYYRALTLREAIKASVNKLIEIMSR